MVILTADGPLQNLLQGIKEPAEFRDKSGKVLGHYNPVLTPEEAAQYEKLKNLFDLEEAKRVFETEKDNGYTFEGVMQHLKSLESKG
jgi:hypothetical protein